MLRYSRPLALLALVIAAPSVGEAGGSPGPIAGASLDPAQGIVHLVYDSGLKLDKPPEQVGDAFGPPQISNDRLTVGWSVLRRDGASYPLPVEILFIRKGAPISVACDQGVPFGWRFEGDDEAVLDCAFPHGPGRRQWQLFNLEKGALTARLHVSEDGNPPESGPPWAKTRMPQT